MCSRGHWRPAEDEKLRELVERYGPHNWNSIALKLHGRSGKSCRLRWFNQLDPRINKTPFTQQEEDRLLASHRIHGNRWSIIARLFPGRTDNAVKNHWHVIMARNTRHHLKRHYPIFHFHHQPPPSSSSSSSSFTLMHQLESAKPKESETAKDKVEFYDFLHVNTTDYSINGTGTGTGSEVIDTIHSRKDKDKDDDDEVNQAPETCIEVPLFIDFFSATKP